MSQSRPPAKYQTLKITPRQRTQMFAALKFWREVAEHSRRPPHTHPKVEPLFRHHSPMGLDELDAFLEKHLG